MALDPAAAVSPALRSQKRKCVSCPGGNYGRGGSSGSCDGGACVNTACQSDEHTAGETCGHWYHPTIERHASVKTWAGVPESDEVVIGACARHVSPCTRDTVRVPGAPLQRRRSPHQPPIPPPSPTGRVGGCLRQYLHPHKHASGSNHAHAVLQSRASSGCSWQCLRPTQQRHTQSRISERSAGNASWGERRSGWGRTHLR